VLMVVLIGEWPVALSGCLQPAELALVVARMGTVLLEVFHEKLTVLSKDLAYLIAFLAVLPGRQGSRLERAGWSTKPQLVEGIVPLILIDVPILLYINSIKEVLYDSVGRRWSVGHPA